MDPHDLFQASTVCLEQAIAGITQVKRRTGRRGRADELVHRFLDLSFAREVSLEAIATIAPLASGFWIVVKHERFQHMVVAVILRPGIRGYCIDNQFWHPSPQVFKERRRLAAMGTIAAAG